MNNPIMWLMLEIILCGLVLVFVEVKREKRQ